jgi:hypothetical protein
LSSVGDDIQLQENGLTGKSGFSSDLVHPVLSAAIPAPAGFDQAQVQIISGLKMIPIIYKTYPFLWSCDLINQGHAGDSLNTLFCPC